MTGGARRGAPRAFADFARPASSRGVLLTLFCVWAAGIEPLSFALLASSALSRVLHYGVPAVGLLLLRLFVAGLGVTVGRAVWSGRGSARVLALLWLGLDGAALALSFATPYFPSNRPPGTKWLELVGLLGVRAAWAAYLACSPRLRDRDDAMPTPLLPS